MQNVKKWLRQNKLVSIFGIVFFIVGYILGLFTNYQTNFSFSFNEKIDAAALLSVICTIILAWVVAVVFEKQKHAEISSKEILTKRCEYLFDMVNDFAHESTSEKILFTLITTSLKKIRLHTDCIYLLAEALVIETDIRLKTEIYQLFDSLNESMTNTPLIDPASKPAPPEVTLSENHVSYSRERKGKITATFNSLNTAITKLTAEIIKPH